MLELVIQFSLFSSFNSYNEYSLVVDTVIEDNLFLSVDASNSDSYSGSGTTSTYLTEMATMEP